MLSGMAMGYRPVDREQEFLLPPAMTDWLDDDHLVWFVIEAVRRMDTTAFHARSRLGGVGRRGYDPVMMVTLFCYAMAVGVRSSRQIERLCATDVAFRVICANDAPDHTVLARFRQAHSEALTELLAQSLLLAAELGFVQLGTVAIDGTKIAANASKDANRTEAGLRKLAAAHLAEIAAADAADDELFGPDRRGDEIPEKVRDRTGRRGRIDEALEVLKARKAAGDEAEQAKRDAAAATRQERVGKAQARHAQARAERQAARAEWETRKAADPSTPGRPPAHPDQHWTVRQAHRVWQQAVAAADPAQDTTTTTARTPANRGAEPKANLTDPQSRLLKTRNGWIQGYNCQTAVSADQFICYAKATNDAIDTNQYLPTVTGITALADQLTTHTGHPVNVGTVLADAGYDSDTNLDAPGPDRLIANANRRTLNHHATHHQTIGDPPPESTSRERNDHRLRTAEGHALYKHRAPLAETPNAWLKDRRGLRQFSRRGQPAANSELNLAAVVTNLLRLRTLGITTAQLATG
jgi:transposase